MCYFSFLGFLLGLSLLLSYKEPDPQASLDRKYSPSAAYSLLSKIALPASTTYTNNINIGTKHLSPHPPLCTRVTIPNSHPRTHQRTNSNNDPPHKPHPILILILILPASPAQPALHPPLRPLPLPIPAPHPNPSNPRLGLGLRLRLQHHS